MKPIVHEALVLWKWKDGADEAIEALNGSDLDGREIVVNEARPRESRGGGGGRYR